MRVPYFVMRMMGEHVSQNNPLTKTRRKVSGSAHALTILRHKASIVLTHDHERRKTMIQSPQTNGSARAEVPAAVIPEKLSVIPLSRIAPPSYDIKPDRTQEQIEDKRQSIRQQRLLNPLLGFWRPDSMFELLDGYTRFLAMLLDGAQEVEVRDLGHVPTPDEAHAIQVTCNLACAQMTDLQLFDAIARQRELTGCSQAGACKRLGISESQGSKIKRMFTVPPEVLEIERRPRALYALSKLSKLNNPAVTIDLAKKAAELPMAVESVEEAVAKLLGETKQKKAKPVKVKRDGALAQLPGDWTWEKIIAWLTERTESARRGLKNNLPTSAFGNL
jgi:ParB-like chromosome segregation protein Spo0J